MHRLILLLLLFVCGILQPLQAQELRATVELRSEALGADGQVHQQALQRQLTDLLSRTRWRERVSKRTSSSPCASVAKQGSIGVS